MPTIECDDLDEAMAFYTDMGFRLDMIMPADSPREVQLSKSGETLRLVRSSKFAQPVHTTDDDWIMGRAGMRYRDLLPDRLGGKLIASHIRLSQGGPVPDYVHYHKSDFQLIYCLKGRIYVVYEDQGEPFWLKPGDCVLQPPEIRHRVLECEAGSEVLELSSPAEHETWIEHKLALPTENIDPGRIFNGQHFARSIAKDAVWKPSEAEGIVERDLGIFDATDGLVDVKIRRLKNAHLMTEFSPLPGMISLGFVVGGRVKVSELSERFSNFANSGSGADEIEILRIQFRDAGHIDTALS